MSFPTSVSTEWVEGQFFVGTRDGTDPDQEPEAIAAQGTVEFVASVPYLPVPTGGPNPFTILPEPRVAVFDSEGYVSTPVPGTLEPAYRKMRLEVNDDPDVSVQDWTWTATYKFTNSSRTIPAHSFLLLAGAPVDLTTVVKVPESAGLGTEQAEALAASAQSAALQAAADAADAAQAASDAAGAAQVTDANISALVGNPATATAVQVTSLVVDATAGKLDADDAVSTYQSQAALDAAAAAKVGTPATALNGAVKTIADASAASAAAPKLDASQKGAASGVATLDSGTKIPVAQVPDAVKADGGAKPVGKGELFKNVLDYKLSGYTDQQAIDAAHAANPVVLHADNTVPPGATLNLYSNTIVTDPIGPYVQSGTPTAPIADARPVIWVQKHVNSAYTGGWDQGAIYGSVIKESGDSFATGLSGYAVTKGTSTGDTIGIHGRTRITSTAGQGFAMWSYIDVASPGAGRAVSLEADIRNASIDPVWAATAGTGLLSGVVVALSDGTYGAHHGIRFPQRSGSDMQRFWTGLQFDTNSIQPTNVDGEGEAIRVRGADYTGGRYGGITIGDHVGTHMVSYGLRTLHADVTDQKAIWLARDHRILFGPDVGSGAGTWISITATNLFDVHNASLAMNGTKVVGGRRTGWGAASGTVDRTAWTAYAAPTVSASYTQAEVQALANAVQANSRHLAALQQDLTTHGLIGA